VIKQAIPNFSNKVALIAHRADGNVDALLSQLRRFNIDAACQWPPRPKDFGPVDIVFFDVDSGFDGMFPWTEAPVPLIAIIGSETPGRLAWAISQNPSAYITKPIGSKGVFQALVTAFHNHADRTEHRREIADLRERLRCRPLVVHTILRIMGVLGVDDDAAFHLLREESMRRRISIEACCQELEAHADQFLLTIPELNRSFARK
jgi:AmiR/NasT family two-component response regulator